MAKDPTKPIVYAAAFPQIAGFGFVVMVGAFGPVRVSLP